MIKKENPTSQLGSYERKITGERERELSSICRNSAKIEIELLMVLVVKLNVPKKIYIVFI